MCQTHTAKKIRRTRRNKKYTSFSFGFISIVAVNCGVKKMATFAKNFRRFFQTSSVRRSIGAADHGDTVGE